MKHGLALAIVMSALAISGCDDDGPTTPMATRIISLSGNMNFGSVTIGTFAERTLMVANNGDSSLSVTGIIVPTGYATNFSATTIQPGAAHQVTIRLTPTAPIAYSGILTVTGDQTSGNNSASITGMGIVGSPLVSQR